ncbi:hypothetical protein HMPREF9446_01143 [Bacteroides fluxus YIT 12057]|uniref:Uncharacterized protein n=1 Tax=Bacteroides fluxus YIT 12057 TaxID=763034 RepID=F3PQZ5_9BACE|nr:hypothetical protein HMPREF9446_01143 [Bacteroides fluxus YIT 12057]
MNKFEIRKNKIESKLHFFQERKNKRKMAFRHNRISLPIETRT